jgi:lipopolysaccharide export system permease protein
VCFGGNNQSGPIDVATAQTAHGGSGRLDFDAETTELIVTLNHAQWEERNEKDPENFSEPSRTGSFESAQPVRLSLQGLFGHPGKRQKPAWMTYEELQVEQARVAALPVAPGAERDHARDVMKIALTIQDKFTMSLAVLSFALIGVPLGIKVSRRETSANLGVAVMLALGYYFLTTAVGWLDRHPEYRPDLLLWLPNVIFFALGFWLFRRIEK